MKKLLLSLVLMAFAGYMSAQSLTFKYEGETVEPGTFDIVSNLNGQFEIQFDLDIINTTDTDIEVVCEMECDAANATQDYLCWGTCFIPGVFEATHTLVAGGEGIFNGHVSFSGKNGILPAGTTSKVTYTFYDKSNPDEKYVFVVNFTYEAPALSFKYEGKTVEPKTFDIVSDLNNSNEIQFDLDVINTTDADINVVLEMECDAANATQDYLCWGTCFIPGVFEATHTLAAGGEGIFNGHCGFYTVDPETYETTPLPSGTTAKITYTFYDERNPEEKYVFVVNFKYEEEESVVDFSSADIFSNAYPNPANNVVSFNYNVQSANSASVAIYNMMGQEVVRQDLNLGGSKVDINVSDLNEGVYFYSLIVNNQTVKTNKFVVSR